ncbi:Uncharacterised protein [uncultured archaeon]|nr:Uncharacterised protein [uncultured archaeon]
MKTDYKEILIKERKHHKAKLKEQAKVAKELREEVKREFKSRFFYTIATALGLVTALLWQTAIIDTIKAFVPIQGAWPYEITVASIITIFAVYLIIITSKLAEKEKKKK